MNPHTSMVLCGMDDGQGFCKVAAVFLDTAADDPDKENNGRAKYSDVISRLNFEFDISSWNL